jgi:hypothetical protein
VRLDSYNPDLDEIVSRKYTQLADIKLSTAKGYIDELVLKYPDGSIIADVPSTPGELLGKKLEGELFLEVPTQNGALPQELIDYAKIKAVKIRDQAGQILNPTN